MREQHHDGAAGWRTEMLVELELQSDLRRKDMLRVVKVPYRFLALELCELKLDIVFKMFPNSRPGL